MATLQLVAPLSGWCLPLSAVPDPVFAERMAGDGIAIDPTSNVLCAPCDGEVVTMPGAQHALTIRSHTGHDILLHLGIDTVQLAGQGFTMLVEAGEKVRAGQPLLRFDLDLIARKAKSPVSPILLAGGEGSVIRRLENCRVNQGEFLMEITAANVSISAEIPHTATAITINRFFNIAFDHGLHARPAAQIAAALRPLQAEIQISAHGRSGNARSTVSIMSLGIHAGDHVEISASGDDAIRALTLLESILGPAVEKRSLAPVAAPAPANVADTFAEGRINGVIASAGIAIGPAFKLLQAAITVEEKGTNVALDKAMLDTAVNAVKSRLETQRTTLADPNGNQHSVLSAHIEMVQDPELMSRAYSSIESGKSAGYAWRRAVRSVIDDLQHHGDPHLVQRVADLRDLENQTLLALTGQTTPSQLTLPPQAILLADELLPSQLLNLDTQRVAALCTARGGPASHVAIIAASLGIPALVAAGPTVLNIADGTNLLLNAEQGYLEVAPSAEQCEATRQELATRDAQRAADLAVAHQPSRTRDRVPINVYANLGALPEAAIAMTNGAEGCGLLRTEFLFQDRRIPPSEDEQAAQYQAFADALGGCPLTIRTLDIGGDKPIPYLPLPHEDNPALGLRGLRTSLWQPELLRTQLRAILRVKPAGQCRILLPMVTDLADIRTVRGMLQTLCAEMGISHMPALGAMIETPASALLANQLVREVEFISIGTNDLSQYTLAMDRGHPELAAKLDALHPAVLRLIEAAAHAGNSQKIEVALCGGLGSDPIAIPILIGLGVHEVSATPAMIPRIKQIIRALDGHACVELAQTALEQADAVAVRQLVQRWQNVLPPLATAMRNIASSTPGAKP